jgi:nitroreductase
MEYYDVILARKSVRKYDPEPIPEKTLKKILEAGRIAPSAKNIQPWRFIVVKDPQMKKKVAEACNNQLFMADADVIVVGCALEKIAYGRMGGHLNSYPIDLAIALDHMILAATSEGLGTCWIGAFSEEKVKEVLAVPDDVRVVALTPIGYPAERAKERPRKELKEIVSYDRY